MLEYETDIYCEYSWQNTGMSSDLSVPIAVTFSLTGKWKAKDLKAFQREDNGQEVLIPLSTNEDGTATILVSALKPTWISKKASSGQDDPGSFDDPDLKKNAITASDMTVKGNGKVQKVRLKASAMGGVPLTYKTDTASVRIDGNGTMTIPASYAGRFRVTVTSSASEVYRSASKKILILRNL